MDEILDKPSTENPNRNKSRHGCVTAWLVLMIVANAATALIYFFKSDLITNSLPTAHISGWMLILMGIVGLLNVIFSLLLFRWKKFGFWGFVITSIIALVLNLMMGLGITQSLLGLTGIGILYAVLQIKKENISAWENLE